MGIKNYIQELREYNSIYEVIGRLLMDLIKYLMHLAWVFVRMTLYWIVKLIYKVFNLSEIDVARQRAKFMRQEALTTIKHEFVFDKSEEFITQWMYFQDLIVSLDLIDADKEEIIENVLALMSETERTAFNTTYDYMITKDLREPSFEDLVIQGIFKNSSDVEPRAKLTNIYSTSRIADLRSSRRDRQADNRSDAKRRGIL